MLLLPLPPLASQVLLPTPAEKPRRCQQAVQWAVLPAVGAARAGGAGTVQSGLQGTLQWGRGGSEGVLSPQVGVVRGVVYEATLGALTTGGCGKGCGL